MTRSVAARREPEVMRGPELAGQRTDPPDRQELRTAISAAVRAKAYLATGNILLFHRFNRLARQASGKYFTE